MKIEIKSVTNIAYGLARVFIYFDVHEIYKLEFIYFTIRLFYLVFSTNRMLYA